MIFTLGALDLTRGVLRFEPQRKRFINTVFMLNITSSVGST